MGRSAKSRGNRAWIQGPGTGVMVAIFTNNPPQEVQEDTILLKRDLQWVLFSPFAPTGYRTRSFAFAPSTALLGIWRPTLLLLDLQVSWDI